MGAGVRAVVLAAGGEGGPGEDEDREGCERGDGRHPGRGAHPAQRNRVGGQPPDPGRRTGPAGAKRGGRGTRAHAEQRLRDRQPARGGAGGIVRSQLGQPGDLLVAAAERPRPGERGRQRRGQ